jgi:hypothetical protein
MLPHQIRLSHMKIISTLAVSVLLHAAILSARADNDGRSDINMGDDQYDQLGRNTPGYIHVSGSDRQYNQNVIRHYVYHSGVVVPGSAFGDNKAAPRSGKSPTSTAKGSSPAASSSTAVSAGK